MKKLQWLRMLDQADDKFVEEAKPGKGRRKNYWLPTLAACLALLLVAGSAVALFLPWGTPSVDVELADPSVSMQEGGQYDPVIKMLSSIDYDVRFVDFAVDENEGMMPTTTPFDAKLEASNLDLQYEITDHQVKGVLEADRIKRTGSHIFYLDGSKLRVYTIAGEMTAQVGSFDLGKVCTAPETLVKQWELYLSPDGSTVMVMVSCLDAGRNRSTRLICLDVSDPENITMTRQIALSGAYLSSRVTEDGILVFTNLRMDGQKMDFQKEETYLPQVDMGNGPESIPGDQILLPKNLSAEYLLCGDDKYAYGSQYLVILQLDAETLDLVSSAALLGWSDTLYVGTDRLVAARGYQQTPKGYDGEHQVTMSELASIRYSDAGLEIQGTADVVGEVKDQYSMDVYDGVIRVVTTTRGSVTEKNDLFRYLSFMETSANLYCIDGETLEVISSVEQFAPIGETVRSVRFQGSEAYVCTAVEVTDPVFFFDLSDVEHITYKETEKIAGYSNSLVDFGKGYLLGMGVGADGSSVKVELYTEGAEKVEPVCAFEEADMLAAANYKSYYIDRENRLFGFGVWDYNSDPFETKYLVLLFDGYDLIPLLEEPLQGVPDFMRGVYIDGYYYMFGQDNYRVKKLF